MFKTSDFFKNVFFLLLLLQFAPMLINSIKKQYTRLLEPHTKVGYLAIKGIILNSSYYTRQLKKFFENNDIKAILLFIESPGGAAGSAEAIAHEIKLLKKDHPKPIITLTENILTSGGYYIAAATDFIIAQPSTLVGSIGVIIPGQFKLQDFIEEYKIHYNVIKAGEYKAATDPFVNATPEQKALLENVAQSSYKNFIDHVARHRPKLEKDKSSVWADGKLFTGNQALSLGLIDLIGSHANAVQKIKETAIIEGEIEWIKEEKNKSLFQLFFNSSDYVDEGNSFMAKMVNSICVTLEERYASQGLRN